MNEVTAQEILARVAETKCLKKSVDMLCFPHLRLHDTQIREEVICQAWFTSCCNAIRVEGGRFHIGGARTIEENLKYLIEGPMNATRRSGRMLCGEFVEGISVSLFHSFVVRCHLVVVPIE